MTDTKRSQWGRTAGEWVESSGMVRTADGRPVCWMDREAGNGILPTERDSNSKFIALAPRMEEALRSVVHYWESEREAGLAVRRAFYLAAHAARTVLQKIEEYENR